MDQAVAQMEMRRYKSHKTVWALKIKEIQQSSPETNVPGGSYELIPEDTRYAPIRVPTAYVTKHQPEPGGYYVVYADGYKSFSPAKAFEEGNTLCTELGLERSLATFGWALKQLHNGKPVTRRGWNGKGMFLYLVPPGAYPARTDIAKQVWGETPVPYRAYIAMKTAQGDVVPWVASQSDVLETDWEIAEL